MSPRAGGHLAMFAFSGLVAGSFALGVLAANEISPEAFNAVRFAIAGVLIGLLASIRGIPRSAARAPWRYLVLGGLFAAYFVLMFHGLKTADPVSAAAVFTLTPLISAVFGYVLLGQVMSRTIALGLSVGAAGALWVIFRGDIDALLRFEVGRGEMIYFVGCVAHAIYTPMVARLNRGESPVVFTFGTLAAGCLVLLALGGPDMARTDWAALPPIVWIALAYISIFASATTFLLLQYATLRIPSSKVMAYTYLTPSWVILWQIGLGAAVPPMIVGVGVGLTVLALVILLGQDPPSKGTPRTRQD